MKLVVGMGSIEEYTRLAKAGADEVFVGYVPYSYYEKYGNLLAANRREVSFYHVQIHTETDMILLKRMMDIYHVPVSITWNALYYSDEQKNDIFRLMIRLLEIGFDRFIVSDLGMLSFLQEKGVKAQIEVSGELGEMNHLVKDWLFQEYGEKPGISRIIFQRKTAIPDMQKITDDAHEWEAFLMNENCQFSGGYCNSMHCDEMVHMCLMPYELKPVEQQKVAGIVNGVEGVLETTEESLGTDGSEGEEAWEELEQDIPGTTGCGLCSLWKLREAGITHLKIVGRGMSPECVVKDVKAAKKALEILEHAEDEASFVQRMKQSIFSLGCSDNCYYCGNCGL